MPIYTRDTLNNLLTGLQQDKPPQVYLLFGERFLCQQAADRICERLLQGGGNCRLIDGETEPFSSTLNKLASFSLFPGRQIYRVSDTKLFHSVKVANSLWKKAAKARQENEPQKAARYLRAMLESAGLDPLDRENDPGTASAAQWKKLFGFTKPQEDLSWTAALLGEQDGETAARTEPVEDAAALLEKTLTSGIPGKNCLVLLAEDVDKRKRLYKYLAGDHVVVDLGVDQGSGSQAQTAQKNILREVLDNTLGGFRKTIHPQAADLLFERVGFNPLAVAMEAEKLALSIGDRNRIEREDLDALVGRTRQEAVFELTDAVGKQNLEMALLVAKRLTENAVHPLAVIATLKNYIRNLLLFRALQGKPGLGYNPSMQPGVFQKNILPALKEESRWQQELSGHPFALYMQFKTAAAFSLARLRSWMEMLLLADFRLKGSPLDPETVMQHLLIAMLANMDDEVLQKKDGALH